MHEYEAGTERLRLDEFLARELTEVSVTRLRRMIATGEVVVNGQASLKGRRLDAGDRVSILAPTIEASSATPEPLPLEILFEDEDLVAVNKPVGLLTHPSHSEMSGTLTNGLAFHFLANCGQAMRAGLVHRLDRNTSGVIIVAKNLRAQRVLSRAFRDRRVSKSYIAIVTGVIEPDSGEINAPIGSDPETWPHWQVLATGREAVTKFIVLRRFASYTLVELTPRTGRTHQLRIHCAFLGHPIVGDLIYGDGNESAIQRFELIHHLLHARSLRFTHPATGDEMLIEAPVPVHWEAIIEELSDDESRI
jgi:23S rRNA pseudouridine1911/1915/1917 synthase